VERAPEHPFCEDEIDLLEALATHSAVSLQVTRQAAIENWRFEQLALVRSVSFQIANVLDLDELATRVTRLILHTFHFYYVGIYTTETNNNSLCFRAARDLQSDPIPMEPGSKDSRCAWGRHGGFRGRDRPGTGCTQCKTRTSFRFVDSLPETQSEVALPLRVEKQDPGGIGCAKRPTRCLPCNGFTGPQSLSRQHCPGD